MNARTAGTATTMTTDGAAKVERWTPLSRIAIGAVLVALIVLAFGPLFFSAGQADRMTALFVYVILAATWNALAGFGGLVSVGQQAFFGLGAYFAVRLANTGMDPFLALVIGGIGVAVVAVPLSYPMLRLRGGEFAIGMWVVAELAHLLVNLDTLVRGETGTSLISLNAYAAPARRAYIYWLAFAGMIAVLGLLFALLRSRTGAAVQALRDDEVAAASLGVKVAGTKRILFTLAAVGAGLAGALWLSTAITFQPKTFFGVQWTAYMVFMVLVGGIGTFEGAIIGAIIFFLVETWLGDTGVWYLIALGGAAVLFALLLPRGIWGAVEDRWGLKLLPVGYRLKRPVVGGG